MFQIIHKIYKILETKEVDCAILCGESNVTYVTGFKSEGALAIIPKGVKKPYFLVPLLDLRRALDNMKNKNFNVFTWSMKEPKDLEIPINAVLVGKLEDILRNY